MPQRDIFHDVVIDALLADGWTITDDPLRLSYGGRNVYVDLGAEMPIGAEKDNRKIAVEIKSFIGESDIHELEIALGQYELYQGILEQVEADRELYMAVSTFAFDGIFSEPIGQLMITRVDLRLMIFDDQTKRVTKWIP